MAHFPLGYFSKLLHTTDFLDFVLWVLMVALVVVAPFTKVEESFGMQAVHDLLFHRSQLAAYDHHTFPGVVARTFIGPIALALTASPWVAVSAMVGLSRLAIQMVVRVVLGSLLVMCFKLFRLEVARKFGQTMSTALGLVCCTQFHLIFYISRTLPNTFALGLVLLALKLWMNERYTRMIFIFTLTAVVFRAETVLLFGGVLLTVLYRRRVKFFWMVWCGVVFGLLCLAVTLGVDSIFWRRLLWPEGSGLLFNVVDNKSHLYGVAPFHWYFTSALPRALLGALPLAVVGFVVESRIRLYVLPALLMVIAFSFLPHKELRFIFYALPLANLAAGAAIAAVWQARASWKRSLGLVLVLGLLVGSLGASSVMLAASAHNYPGGEAIVKLHRLKADALPGTSVWIDNLAAQTGVTLFLQERPDWFYSKVPEEDVAALTDFTLLISEKEHVRGFREIGSVSSFAGLRLSWKNPIRFKTALRLFENTEG